MVIGSVQLYLRDEDIVNPVDLTFIEVGVICACTASIMHDPQAFAQVVKQICPVLTRQSTFLSRRR